MPGHTPRKMNMQRMYAERVYAEKCNSPPPTGVSCPLNIRKFSHKIPLQRGRVYSMKYIYQLAEKVGEGRVFAVVSVNNKCERGLNIDTKVSLRK